MLLQPLKFTELKADDAWNEFDAHPTRSHRCFELWWLCAPVRGPTAMSFVCSKRDAASRCRLKAAGGSSHANGRVIEMARQLLCFQPCSWTAVAQLSGSGKSATWLFKRPATTCLGLNAVCSCAALSRFSVLEVIRLGQRREGSGSRRVFG